MLSQQWKSNSAWRDLHMPFTLFFFSSFSCAMGFTTWFHRFLVLLQDLHPTQTTQGTVVSPGCKITRKWHDFLVAQFGRFLAFPSGIFGDGLERDWINCKVNRIEASLRLVLHMMRAPDTRLCYEDLVQITNPTHQETAQTKQHDALLAATPPWLEVDVLRAPCYQVCQHRFWIVVGWTKESWSRPFYSSESFHKSPTWDEHLKIIQRITELGCFQITLPTWQKLVKPRFPCARKHWKTLCPQSDRLTPMFGWKRNSASCACTIMLLIFILPRSSQIVQVFPSMRKCPLIISSKN